MLADRLGRVSQLGADGGAHHLVPIVDGLAEPASVPSPAYCAPADSRSATDTSTARLNHRPDARRVFQSGRDLNPRFWGMSPTSLGMREWKPPRTLRVASKSHAPIYAYHRGTA